MKVIREAIYKSIRNDANYSAEEMKKDVVKQFQDQYLLKVNNQDTDEYHCKGMVSRIPALLILPKTS